MNVPASDEVLLMRAMQRLEQTIDAFGDRMEARFAEISKNIDEFKAGLGKKIDSLGNDAEDDSISAQLGALHDLAKRAYAPT